MNAKINQSVEKYFDEVKALATSMYENPECALEEVESAKKIVALLKDKGWDVETGCAGLPTAFKAVKKAGSGARVAIPVEYDALPGIGHACGHHLITTMSVLAGLALGDIIEETGGEVALLGTPAEETGEGKPPMIQAGCFDGYDAAMMVHPHSATYAETVITSIGVYDITFKGQAAHCGAAPWDGINALDAVVQMYNNVSMMRQQLYDGTRIAGIVLSGGAMTNSVPDSCVIRYEIRTLTMDYYDHVAERLRKCAEAAALATGCEMTFELSMPICNSMRHSSALVDAYREILADYGEEETSVVPSPIATDMGDVSQVIPSAHPLVKVADAGEMPHSPEFLCAVNQPYAWDKAKNHAKMLAELGYKVLTDAEMLEKLKAEKAELSK